jgi:P-type Cu+ transporter
VLAEQTILTKCYHCGDDITDLISFDKYSFCCYACKNVYEILKTNKLTDFYQYNQYAGRKVNSDYKMDYSYLSSEDVLKKLLVFKNEKQAHLYIKLPAIHCSSCIWLLENLKRLNTGIIATEVNFSEKKLFLIYQPSITNLAEVAELLEKIGYKPVFEEISENEKIEKNKSLNDLYLRLAVAGFAFGNIMLMTFPDYIDSGFKNSEFFKFFPFLCLLLSIPVLLYSAMPYFKSAFYSLKELKINIDLPISMGIIALFLQSLFDIFLYSKFGYLDSFSAFVFFLLIGRIFQEKSYEHLSFEKNFKSFFPLSVQRKVIEKYEDVLLESLEKGDVIKVRNNEIIPADSVCLDENINVDYSFVTGESELQVLVAGENVFAGGKLLGKSAHFLIQRAFNKSHLVKIWNNATEKKGNRSITYADQLSFYFTVLVTIIAFIAFLDNISSGLDEAVNRFLAVIIVACPCAIALTSPFTFGTVMAILARIRVFIKNTDVLENLSRVDALVFDKTGTLSDKKRNDVEEKLFENINKEELALVLNESIHPLSQSILKILPNAKGSLLSFTEIAGKGIDSLTADHSYLIGSADFLGIEDLGFSVYIQVNGKLKAAYKIKEKFRNNLMNVFSNLSKDYKLYLLSGDKKREKSEVYNFFPDHGNIYFEQNPKAKYNLIKQIKSKSITAMFGDGINDSAALNEADVGIAVVDDFYQFSPSADVIIEACELSRFNKILAFIKSSKSTIVSSFIISILYNILGIYFAYTGQLEPVVCAIIMPISSVSVILFTVLKTKYHALRWGLL